MSEGISGESLILCRQPKTLTITPRPIASLYKSRTDGKWQRLIGSCNVNTKEFINIKVKDVVLLGKEFPCIKITLRNGKDIVATSNVKLYTRRGFVAFKDLTVLDSVGCKRKSLMGFSSIDAIRSDLIIPGSVFYTLQLESSTNYIVNGMIVEG